MECYTYAEESGGCVQRLKSLDCCMPVRYPPNEVPRRMSRDSAPVGLLPSREPNQSLTRRIIRQSSKPAVIHSIVFLSAIVLGVLIYYWTVFSAHMTTLAGEKFTPLGRSMRRPSIKRSRRRPSS